MNANNTIHNTHTLTQSHGKGPTHRDHPVGKVAVLRHLHGPQDSQVHVAAEQRGNVSESPVVASLAVSLSSKMFFQFTHSCLKRERQRWKEM